jgi:RNA-directed DNA polymerase
MDKIIREFILKEAEKHAQRYQLYHNYLHIDYIRNTKRIKNPPLKKVLTPDCWSENKKFNPFYVLKHINAITKSITTKIKNGTYCPNPPFQRKIPKKGGGFRIINIYQIPDAAVSNMLYSSLLAKNKHRFSSLSYAYRNDRNVHFAIQDIGIDFAEQSRIFIAEFDFSDFFGSIKHDYLKNQYSENGFFISEVDKKIINSFLGETNKGVPQGTSISLFLANLACWKLDRLLENEGVRFARYADDTVIWSTSYQKICNSFSIIEKFSKESEVLINLKKSAGISLLLKEGMPSEFPKFKNHIDFLGYAISSGKVSIKQASVRKIKMQISYLLYRNLLQPFTSPKLQGIIIPNNGIDPAFITAIMQVRRYLYGGLNEVALRRYLKGESVRIKFKGVMSYYPLVNNTEQLEMLDKWLVCTVLKILNKREKVLKNLNKMQPTYKSFPFNLKHSNIIKDCRIHKFKNKVGLAEIPSFLRIHKAIYQGLVNQGIGFVINSNSNAYNYDE